MNMKRWVKRMVILDLFMAGLLFLTPFGGRGAAPAVSLLPPGTEAPEDAGSRSAGGAEKDAQDAGSRSADVAKRVALTFDDGPHPKYTEMLLDGLKERGVKATFFVTGANVGKYPEIVRRMQKEGHLIGNHTYHHIQLTAANGEQFREEIVSTNEAIREVTGKDTEYIRPPYGSWDKRYEEELNMFPVLWTVDPKDWCSDDAACIVKNTIARIKDNDIILLHDQYGSSVAAALEIVDELGGKGYEFVTVDEILFD